MHQSSIPILIFFIAQNRIILYEKVNRINWVANAIQHEIYPNKKIKFTDRKRQHNIPISMSIKFNIIMKMSCFSFSIKQKFSDDRRRLSCYRESFSFYFVFLEDTDLF